MRHSPIDELKSKSPAKGVEMRMMHGEKMSMVFFRLDPGAEVPEHTHPHEQMGTVMEGSVELMVKGKRQTVRKGEAYHIPSNEPHSGRCGDSPAFILEVFSPPRQDLME